MIVYIGPYEDEYREVNIHVDDYDIWSVDNTLALLISPLLKKFKEKVSSYPSNLSSIDDWYLILDQMIYSFEYIQRPENYNYDNDKELMKVQHGLNLFAQYFKDLWD